MKTPPKFNKKHNDKDKFSNNRDTSVEKNVVINEETGYSYYSPSAPQKTKVTKNKKVCIVCVSVLLIFVFIVIAIVNGNREETNYGDSNITATTVIKKYDITVKISSITNLMFSTYDINVFIDDEKVGTVKNGEFQEYSLTLEEGEHNLRLENAEDSSVNGEMDFDIYFDDKIQFNIFSKSDEISIEESSYEEETTKESTTKETVTEETTETTYEKKENILTADNCPELKEILAIKDPADPKVADFYHEHLGDTIEFNGCVMLVENHIDNKGKVYKTRYDVILGAGDFNEDSQIGPNFKFDDVNRYDMGLTADSLYVGQNVKVRAIVGEYNENTTIFLLEPISVDER